MFLAIVITIWTGVHAYIFWRAVLVFQPGRKLRLSLIPTMLVLSSLYVAGRILWRSQAPDWLARWVLEVGAVWGGLVSILITLLLVLELSGLLVYLGTLVSGEGRTLWGVIHDLTLPQRRWVGAGLWAVVLAAVAVSLIEARASPRLVKLEMQFVDPTGRAVPLKILQISDVHLHAGTSTADWRRTLAQIARVKPDRLAISGDFIDDRTEKTEKLVRALVKAVPGVPIYAVLGNHELYTGIDHFIRVATRNGIRVLRQQTLELTPGLHIGGIDDARIADQRAAVAEIVGKVPARAGLVLIAHRPQALDRIAKRGSALVLAGHTHGGQVPPFHLLTRLATRGYLAGLYRRGSAWLYVSKGTGTWGPPMRLAARREMVLVEARPGERFQVRKKDE